MTGLSKDAILGADDLPREPVEIPAWGGTVYVRMMTAAERDDWEAAFVGDDAKKPPTARERLRNLRARLAVLTVTDVAGSRLFTEADAEALGRKSGAALDLIFAAARRINALDQRDVDALAKN